jgi:hypothetical protein
MEASGMFSVEWLKGGKVIHDQPTLGETMADVLRVSIKDTPDIVKSTGQQPDTIHIHDHLRNETFVHIFSTTDAPRP